MQIYTNTGMSFLFSVSSLNCINTLSREVTDIEIFAFIIILALLLKEGICSVESKFFHLKVVPVGENIRLLKKKLTATLSELSSL